MQAAQDPDVSYFHQLYKEELINEPLDNEGKPRKILYCEFIEINDKKDKFEYNLLNQYPDPNKKNLLITYDNM